MAIEINQEEFRKEILLELHPLADSHLTPRLDGTGKKRLLILGTGQLVGELCSALESRRKRFGGDIEIVGFLDANPERIGECLFSSRIVGTFDQLVQAVEHNRVDTIVVCMEDRRSILPTQQLLNLKAMGFDIIEGHKLFEEVSGRLSIDSLHPSTVVFSRGFRRRPILQMSKRLFDVLVSAVGLIVLCPCLLLIAALIRIDSPGPILYRQVRVGLYGRPYVMWKFRSMKQDAELSGPQWAQANDSRISRVGRWLRKARLDELPQLMNVLRGEMSLVGPRPERPIFVKNLRQVIPYYDMRHTVKPGLTGWAQVKFHYANSQDDAHKKLQYDLYYVKNSSIVLDMKIMCETIPVLLTGKGAY